MTDREIEKKENERQAILRKMLSIKDVKMTDAQRFWVKAKDCMPPSDDYVIAYDQEDGICISSCITCNKERIWFNEFPGSEMNPCQLNHVTHWMSLSHIPIPEDVIFKDKK